MSSAKKGARTRYSNDLKREIDAQDTQDLNVVEQQAREYNIDEIYDGVTKVTNKLSLLITQYDKLESANVDFSIAIENDAEKTTTFEALLDSEAPLMTKANHLIARFKTLKEQLKGRENHLINETAAHDVLVAQNRDLRERLARQLVVADLPGPVNANLPNPAGGARAKTSIKLPQLEIAKFRGDILKWREFWDLYETGIHTHPDLSDVEKFAHLRSKLEGDALTAISGFQITNNNYKSAVDVLQKRFGKNQAIINAHYISLSDLPSSPNQVPKLRQLYDSLEMHFRSLDAVGEDVNNQRHLVSVILSKLPEDVLFQLNMQFEEGDEWTVELSTENFSVVIFVLVNRFPPGVLYRKVQ